jgi:hypothetical protein
MALPLIALPFIKQGLNLVGSAVLSKGKQYIEDKTGLDLSEPENLSPEAIERLRVFEKEHAHKLLELINEDLNSARQLQKVALEQADLFSKRFVYYFAAFWSFFATGYISFITFGSVPMDNVRFADTVLGFLLGTIIATIIAFFYGSSSSSRAKDHMLEDFVGKIK